MSWSTIAAAEVLQEFTPAEKAALDAIQGVTTNLAAILVRVVGMARGMISAGGNALGPTDTIPDQVRLDVVAVARWRWLVAIPTAKALQTPERKEQHDAGMKRLEAIALGKPKVESPDTVGTAASEGSTLVGTGDDNPFSQLGTT